MKLQFQMNCFLTHGRISCRNVNTKFLPTYLPTYSITIRHYLYNYTVVDASNYIQYNYVARMNVNVNYISQQSGSSSLQDPTTTGEWGPTALFDKL